MADMLFAIVGYKGFARYGYCMPSSQNTPVIREACHVDRAHATRHLFMACRGRYIPLQFLTLMLLSFILFVVFLSCTLVAPKYTKRPAHVKNSRLLLCSQVASNIFQSQQTCHFNPICLEQGVAKLAPHGCIRKITPMLHSNILTQWPAQDRDLRCVFIGAGVVWELPLLMETAKQSY